MSRATTLHDRSPRPTPRRARSRRQPQLGTLEERCTPTHPISGLPSSYTLTDLGTLGGRESVAYAVNALGQVVGAADYEPLAPRIGEARHGFFYSDGKLRDLGSLTHLNSVARSLNDFGQAAGWVYDDDTWAYAVVWDAGTDAVLDLDIRGRAFGINNAAQVVGEFVGGGGFLWQDGKIFRVPKLPGDETTTAYAINDAGQVAGASLGFYDKLAEMYVSSRAILWQPGSEPEDLGTLRGREHSEALAVNSHGQVVGRSGTITCGSLSCGWTTSRAFLWQRDIGMIDLGDLGRDGMVHAIAYGVNNGGQAVGTIDGTAFVTAGGPDGAMLDLNELIGPSIWHLTAATSINDSGQIVGYGNVAGQTRAFLLTPLAVPRALPPLPTDIIPVLMAEPVEAAARFPSCLLIQTLFTDPGTAPASLLREHNVCLPNTAQPPISTKPVGVPSDLIVLPPDEPPTDPPVAEPFKYAGPKLTLHPWYVKSVTLRMLRL